MSAVKTLGGIKARQRDAKKKLVTRASAFFSDFPGSFGIVWKRISMARSTRRGETDLSRTTFSDLGFHARILGDDKARQAMVSARVCVQHRVRD